MVKQLLRFFRRCASSLRYRDSAPRATTTSKPTTDLPPPPRELINNRVIYEIPLLERRSRKLVGDTPLAALYRIYEHLCLDQHLEIRNELEAFWYHNTWAVRDIPEPQDPDPERYACLACIPKMLCLAFNKRMEIGMHRDAPPILTRDEMDEWRSKAPRFEEEPPWVVNVPPLPEILAIPHWDNEQRDFVTLHGFEDDGASAVFQRKNILILELHIHFV